MKNSIGAVLLFRRSWFTGSLLVLLSIISVGFSSCTSDVEEVNHAKQLHRVQKGVLDWRFTYNDFNKVEKTELYLDLITLVQVETNTYDKKGRLIEKYTVHYPLSDDRPDWRETFTYDKGKLVNGYYRQMGQDTIKEGYRYHKIVSEENRVLEYTATVSWQDEMLYRLKRSISAGGNVDLEEKVYRGTPGNKERKREMEYDEQQNPLYGINYSSPFDILNSNKNNVTQLVESGSLESTRTYKYTYEYVDGYPISRQEDVYNENDDHLSSQKEYYFYN